MTEWDAGQVSTWHALFDGVTRVLADYGTEYSRGQGDYLVVEDNYGWRRVTLSVQNLKMLDPEIVRRLRGLLSNLPDWEIAIAVDIPGQESAWPVMGLTLRQHEIIDGLQRQYFPPAFQAWAYEDARPGTGFD